MIDLILHFLLLGAFILVLAKTLPGIRVDGYGTALGVAVVYGLVNLTLGFALKLLSLPFVIITAGLFLVVINAVVLWITDELIEDFEIDTATTTLIAALCITVADTLLGWVF